MLAADQDDIMELKSELGFDARFAAWAEEAVMDVLEMLDVAAAHDEARDQSWSKEFEAIRHAVA